MALSALVPTGGRAEAVAARTDAHAAGPAYWLVAADGGVFAFGRGAYEGGLAGNASFRPLAGLAVTPSGHGYLLAGSNGGVYAFGDAHFAGGVAGRIRSPIVSVVMRPKGAGYWLASADGGVFAFGGAPFYGAASNVALRQPIVSMAPTPSGLGYWLVAADGAVLTYGDAPFLGSAANFALQAPVVAITPTPDGNGYWLTAGDGAVFAFGNAPYLGGLSDTRLLGPIVGVARTRSGRGYWLASADGGIFSYGDAEFYGSVGATTLSAPVVGIASGSGDAIPTTPTAPTSVVGYDLSWPQCGGLWPSPPYGFGVVGITGGHLFSVNPCLREQWQWATDHGSFAGLYVNTNSFTPDELPAFLAGAAVACKGSLACAYHEWGRLGADAALKAAKDLSAPMWWLDVETGNVWSPDTNANAFLLQGMIDELRAHGKRVGIYSTALQFSDVAGGYAPAVPTWVAGADPGNPAASCSGRSFGGGPTWMVQDLGGAFDIDVLCAAGISSYKVTFSPPRKMSVPTYSKPAPAAKNPARRDPLPLLGVSRDALAKASGAILEARPRVPGWIKAGGAVVVLAFLGLHGHHHRHPAQPSR